MFTRIFILFITIIFYGCSFDNYKVPVEETSNNKDVVKEESPEDSSNEQSLYPIDKTAVILGNQRRSFCQEKGEIIPAFCKDTGFTGYRECFDGHYMSRTYCNNPAEDALNQEAKTVVITPKLLEQTPGFNKIVNALGKQTEVVTVEQIISAIPRGIVAESIRDFIEYSYYNELWNLRQVILIGDMVLSPEGDMVTYPSESVLIPLKYEYSIVQNIDREVEKYWVGSSYFGVPAKYWDYNQGHKYWTPDFISNRMVDVGFIQADGRNICNKDGKNCKTDLQIIAEKLSNWKINSSFTETQFNSGACWDGPGNHWSIDNGYDIYEGRTNVFFHNCDNEKNIGDVGKFGIQDNATVMTIAGHGNPIGTQLTASNGESWGSYRYDINSIFGGVVYLYSCSIGAPDLRETSLIQSQLANPDGAITVIGHSRIMSNPGFSPWRDMVRYGWTTIGDAVYGTMYNQLQNYSNPDIFKAQSDIIIGGSPAIKIASYTKGVQVLNYRFNDDQSIDAYLFVSGVDKNESIDIFGGGEKITSVVGSGETTVHIKPGIMDRDDIFNIPCDLDNETCMVGGFESRTDIKVEIDDLIDIGNNQYGATVRLNHRIRTKDTNLMVELVTLNCSEGTNSSCFIDGWAGQNYYNVGDNIFPNGVDTTEFIKFSLENFKQAPTEYTRAIRVKVKHLHGDKIFGVGHIKLNDIILDKLRLF